jgi:ribosomal protein S18 acetylase RimI-like enzyme
MPNDGHLCRRNQMGVFVTDEWVAVLGKVEGHGENWHGHVTAVTVAPEYRRQQLAKKLMIILEDITEKT